MAQDLSLIFAGTPAFAVPALQALAASRHRILAVYTQPDRRAGRGLTEQPGPVKLAAAGMGLPVVQPATLRDAAAVAGLAAWQADVMVVVAYGLLLPQAVLDIPRLGCINIHASLLPRWRGAAPIQRALQAGDEQTGISIMRMEAGLDTGPVLARRAMPIGPDDTAASLHDRLAAMGAGMIVESLDRLAAGAVPLEAQDDSLACYARKVSKDEAPLDWSQPAPLLERQIRAFNPWPVAETRLDGTQLRVWLARAEARFHDVAPGTVLDCDEAGIGVACGQGVLRLLQVQLPGRRVVSAAELGRARQLTGCRLG